MPSYTETLQRVMAGDYTSASDDQKNSDVQEVIKLCSIAAAAVTVQPFPLLDSALITPIQIGMVQAIGRVRGFTLDKKSIIEILSTLGASIIAQNVTIAASKLIPFVGWAVGISMSYALTYSIGEVSDYYFRSGRLASSDDLKERFKQTFEAKKKEKQQQAEAQGTLKERLTQLTQTYEAKLISEEEFMKKKQEILASL